MSAINVLEAMNLLKPEQVTVQNLLIENGQLIETVAEYQRMGKIVEATKYQERLHRNLIYLAKLADSTCSSHLLLEIGGAIPPTDESPPPAEPLLTVTNSANPPNIVATIANAGLPHQQQCQPAVSVAIVSQTSPPNGHAQRGISTTPPAHGVQYQFPSPPQPSPHTQTTQQQQPTTANVHYSQSHQQQAVPFQRNLNVPSHPMLFQHQQNVQLSQQQQQMGTQQHSVVYAGGHAMPTQHHQQYSAAYPLLQQQQQSQQFPPSTGAAFAPMVYQHTPSHSVLQHGTSHAGGYLAQQK
ncbi:hypothetical protein niasHS_003543 [Heterodera schachtii]|uniref:SS18 N-terminal domain-containing protein n=1 Tax=Heterodera schachtii TaxID=97005 RepID=A0ABD2KGU4_HETSC